MKRSIILLLTTLLGISLWAQPISSDHEPTDFTPGISSISLRKGQLEANIFHSFLPKIDVFNWAESPFQQLEGKRQLWQNLFQFTYGISPGRNVNLGLDIRHIRLVSDFEFQSQQFDTKASAFHLGPRVRWRPLGKLSEDMDLTIQNYVHIPITTADGAFPNKPTFGNQFIFTRRFGFDWILLAQLDITILPKTEIDDRVPIAVPLSVFGSYVYRSNLIFYGLVSYLPEFGSVKWAETDRYYRRRSAMNAGAGFQWSPVRSLDFYLHYIAAFGVYRDGGSNSINLGLRFMHP